MENLIDFAKEKKVTLDCNLNIDGFLVHLKKLEALIERLEVAVEKAEEQDTEECDPDNTSFWSGDKVLFWETDIPDEIKASTRYQYFYCEKCDETGRVKLPSGIDSLEKFIKHINNRAKCVLCGEREKERGNGETCRYCYPYTHMAIANRRYDLDPKERDCSRRH